MATKTKISVTVVTEKEGFKVSDWNLKHYSMQRLQGMLSAFNQTGGSNFYLLDYYRKKIIVDSPASLILCGHSKDFANKKGFGFFQYILSEHEWIWLSRMNKEAYKFLFNYPEDKRKNFVVSYDLKLSTKKGKELLLHHRVTPYKLCGNGNIWLGLCHAWASSENKSGQPYIINQKTGERYDFIKNKFVKSNTISLTEEELMILRLLVQELSEEDVKEQLKISSVANLKYKKRELFQKLGAKTSASAIHKAHLLGII